MCVCLVGLVLWWCSAVLLLFYFYSVLSLHNILPQSYDKDLRKIQREDYSFI